ncbi:hypothetical protein C2G38_1585802 [Gigaspora rosea]|uniref:Uncharacterized protein n=1 Tax=Gigaspora rosea TaxID=44941 RepID=A0A397W278_9GLOM|nr:hypothetical protein C2G38_1585802 [Gigaspora rosea]
MSLKSVHAVNNECLLYFNVLRLINKWFNSREKNPLSLFICLDISGSMHGAIGQAKDAILQIIECLIHGGILSESDITCFIYNSECNVVNFSENPNMLLANGEIKKFFDTVNAGGGTSFASVFAKIIENLSQINNDLAIIFFTDGVDDSTLNEELKNNLKGALSNIPYGTEVHSIGFTENHNASQ